MKATQCALLVDLCGRLGRLDVLFLGGSASGESRDLGRLTDLQGVEGMGCCEWRASKKSKGWAVVSGELPRSRRDGPLC